MLHTYSVFSLFRQFILRDIIMAINITRPLPSLQIKPVASLRPFSYTEARKITYIYDRELNGNIINRNNTSQEKYTRLALSYDWLWFDMGRFTHIFQVYLVMGTQTSDPRARVTTLKIWVECL